MPSVRVVVEDSLRESFYRMGLGVVADVFLNLLSHLTGWKVGSFGGLWYDCLPGMAQGTEEHPREVWAEGVS